MDAQTLRRALFDLFKFDPKQFSVRGSGTSFLVSLLSRSNGGTGNNNHPFKLVNASTTEDGVTTFNVRVIYGTVNSMVPDGMSPGDIPPYVLEVTESGYIYLVIVTDTNDSDFTITSLTIGDFASVQTDDPDTFTYYIQIGSFDITDDKLTPAQAISGSQTFALCGGGAKNTLV